ncbi:MAG: glycosyltransferase family 4 protein [Candidatus Saccharimonadales bacterium]
MNILWLAWKDLGHPARGGAEVVMHELINRQLVDGHAVTLLTAKYPDAAAKETLANGLHVIRVGSNRFLHSAQALWYYLRHLRGKFNLIIETVNTAPYFSLLFRGRAKGLAFYHQLARDVWFFETKAPLSYIGFFLIEPLATWLLSRAKTPLITVSESTKQDLARFGWPPQRTHIISEGIGFEPVKSLSEVKKFDRPTMLSLGAMRGMKRTLDQIHAFEIAKQSVPDLQMKIAGDAYGKYGQRVLAAIRQSPYAKDIEYLGRVSEKQKQLLMQQAHVITVTSVKEGWGLIVTEAASQGTPAIVYDADGLRDSVRNHQTGMVVTPGSERLAAATVFSLKDKTRYQAMQQAAWEWSKRMTFDKSYQDLKQAMEEA